MSHNNLNFNDTARNKAVALRCVYAMDVIKLGIEITTVSVY